MAAELLSTWAKTLVSARCPLPRPPVLITPLPLPPHIVAEHMLLRATLWTLCGRVRCPVTDGGRRGRRYSLGRGSA